MLDQREGVASCSYARRKPRSKISGSCLDTTHLRRCGPSSCQARHVRARPGLPARHPSIRSPNRPLKEPSYKNVRERPRGLSSLHSLRFPSGLFYIVPACASPSASPPSASRAGNAASQVRSCKCSGQRSPQIARRVGRGQVWRVQPLQVA